MNLLPKTLGTRPRLALEFRPEGVVAARSEDAQALVSAVAYGLFSAGTLTPGLKHGNVVGRAEVVSAVRKALEAVTLKDRMTTIVLPDTAVRVLLLDFDSLPAKETEALPVVRFRLKKLLPFEADDAVVSYQVMSTAKNLVRVLAVAVPKEVLAEYEGVVREAGFEPGAVLPSTLAALAGMNEIEAAALLVNAGGTAVTTAIVQGGVLLLHRTVDLAAEGVHEIVDRDVTETAALPALGEVPAELLASPVPQSSLSLVDEESSAGEWAMQAPARGYGVLDDRDIAAAAEMDAAERLAREIEAEVLAEAARASETPAVPREGMLPPMLEPEVEAMDMTGREVTQAVSVAAAYFEDTLQMAPGVVLAAGPMGAQELGSLLSAAGFGSDEMRVREMIDPAMLTAGAVSTRVPYGWMAGVRGALRS